MKPRSLGLVLLGASALLLDCSAELRDVAPCHAMARVWCDHLASCAVAMPADTGSGDCEKQLEDSCNDNHNATGSSSGSSSSSSSSTELSDVRACLDATDSLACGATLPSECSGLRSYLGCNGVGMVKSSACGLVPADGSVTPTGFATGGQAGKLGASGSGAGPGSGGTGGSGGSFSPGAGGSTPAGGEGGSPGIDASKSFTCASWPSFLRFDGQDDRLTIARSVGDHSFTVEMWLRTTQSGPSSGQFYLGTGLVFGEVAGVTNDFGVVLLGGQLGFGTGNPDQTAASQSSVSTGKWTHVAAVRDADSATLSVFVNGQLEGQASGVGTQPLTSPSQLYVGASLTSSGPAGGGFFAGDLAELRLWNVARTPAQIKATLGQALSGHEPGLAAYYRMSEGKGSTVHESVSGASTPLGEGSPQLSPAWVANPCGG